MSRNARVQPPQLELYITGAGQRVFVHRRNASCASGCVIHHPTDPHQEWPTYWRADRQMMERLCTHGVGHPDRDHIAFIRFRYGDAAAATEAVHGCCGCCGRDDTPPVTSSP